jgi:hypothetical protein
MTIATLSLMSYIGILSLPVPVQCEPTYCEAWQVEADGSLLCFDDDETFPEGHWSYDIGPDYNDLQVTVEY